MVVWCRRRAAAQHLPVAWLIQPGQAGCSSWRLSPRWLLVCRGTAAPDLARSSAQHCPSSGPGGGAQRSIAMPASSGLLGEGACARPCSAARRSAARGPFLMLLWCGRRPAPRCCTQRGGWPRPAGHPPARPAAAAALWMARFHQALVHSAALRLLCALGWLLHPPCVCVSACGAGAAAALGCGSGAGLLCSRRPLRWHQGWRRKGQPQQRSVSGACCGARRGRRRFFASCCPGCTPAAARGAGGRSPPAGPLTRRHGLPVPCCALQRSAATSAQDLVEYWSDVAALH
jgi:hypothetical protein